MSKNINIEVIEKLFYELDCKDRYVLFKGGTSAGKTWTIIQYLINELLSNNDIFIVVGVETLASAKSNIIKDFEDCLGIFNVIKQFKIDKQMHIYKNISNKSSLRFIPCDKPSKWFGLRADIFWFNEAIHIDKNIFEQAEMRLRDKIDYNNKIILDYNPTNPHSWVRELENDIKPGGIKVIKSTYKDNPFLGENQKKMIESFRETNKNKWLVYGVGEYGEVRGSVFDNWETVDEFPTGKTIYYGIDFGFTNDPTTIIRATKIHGELYVDELEYINGLTNDDIIKKLVDLGVDKEEIIADSAEPKSIEEIKRAGFNIEGARKGPDSILNGIDILKRYKINITKRSKKTIDEFVNYIWKEDRSTGKFLNKPVDNWNHSIDALRYIALNKFKKKRNGPGIKFISV